MRHFAWAVAGWCVLCSTIIQGQEGPRPEDPWDYWKANTKLWGANIYQEVDPEDRQKWRPLLRPHDFEDLQRAGANSVNLSVPGPYDPDSGQFNSDNWDNLKQRIQWAKKAGLKVVISFRTAPGRNEADITKPFTSEVKRDLLDDPSSPNVAKFCEMWKKVAEEYGKDNDVVGFDLLVEPHAPKLWEKEKYQDSQFRKSENWRKVAQQVIKTIRDDNIQTPILVEPDLWAAALYLNRVDDPDPDPKVGPQPWKMVEGERLVCAVHQYHPSDYTEQGTENFDVEFVALRCAFHEISKWKKSHPNIPVCLNEFGLKQGLPYAELFLKKELRLLKQQQLNHAVWLWEVTDPQQDYRDFDVRSNPKLLRELMANWRENANNPDGQPCPAENGPRGDPPVHAKGGRR
ncbi:MAG: cellulase family glycosylhydrolase [Planctomycetes bacterium]|nr:cellulase family glycosylhydrolase [Planctomycetota bacterium]